MCGIRPSGSGSLSVSESSFKKYRRMQTQATATKADPDADSASDPDGANTFLSIRRLPRPKGALECGGLTPLLRRKLYSLIKMVSLIWGNYPGFRYWIGSLCVPHLRCSFVFLHQTPASRPGLYHCRPFGPRSFWDDLSAEAESEG